MNKKMWLAVLLVCGEVLAAAPKLSQTNTQHHQSSIKGYQTKDYVVQVKKGQTLTVSIQTTYPDAYFNVLLPNGETSSPSENDGKQFKKVAAQTGKYRVRVHQMRAFARRGAVAKYRLSIRVDS